MVLPPWQPHAGGTREGTSSTHVTPPSAARRVGTFSTHATPPSAACAPNQVQQRMTRTTSNGSLQRPARSGPTVSSTEIVPGRPYQIQNCLLHRCGTVILGNSAKAFFSMRHQSGIEALPFWYLGAPLSERGAARPGSCLRKWKASRRSGCMPTGNWRMAITRARQPSMLRTDRGRCRGPSGRGPSPLTSSRSGVVQGQSTNQASGTTERVLRLSRFRPVAHR